jgi:putative DNA primase/helicase
MSATALLPAQDQTAAPTPEEEDSAPRFSDEALALDFAASYASVLRYVAAHGRWMVFSDGSWSPDDTLFAFSLARLICREHARGAPEKLRKELASASTVAAVERLARADDRLCATVDQWDADPWRLNTPAGMVDLRTGTTWPACELDYATKITGTAPALLKPECPLWHEFLDRITGGDVDLQGFLARMFGYALTGSTSAHALFFFYGTGGNGKSVLLDTVTGIFGNYAKSAAIETFTASNFDRHPTDLAGLQGARLVTAIETEEGRAWAEARIKALTGGDRIAARFMRQDFFEYVPQFKLVVAGNHKPSLRNVDEAIRRRFHLVPFTVTIPAAERDPNLKDKLRAEWPAILSWMLAGCREWQRIGLAPPKAVTEATAAYLEAEDAMAGWLAERCLTEPEAWASSTDLFQDWKRWAERAGEPARTQKRFVQDLETRGFVPFRRMTGRGFQGLRLVPEMAAWSEP